jgi:carboxyl-terminal processing protease
MKLVQSAAVAALAAPLLLALPCSSRAATDADAAGVPPADLRLFEQVMRRVERSYVHPVTPDQLTTNALKGMVNRLDPHSDYMDEKEYKQTAADISGAFGGIGIRISEETGMPKIISPIDGTPAARAGLEPGDLIVAVNGQATDGMDLLQTVAALRGKPGSRVTLTIERGNKAPFPVTLTRATIDVPTVK